MGFINNKRLISSKEIVARFRIPYSTVTYYTNLGFFMVVKRRGNRRFYDAAETARQIKRITEMRDSGYPLRLIRKKLAR